MRYLTVITGVMVLAGAAHGQIVVFDNFGPEFDYEIGTGYTVSGADGRIVNQGDAFVPSESGELAGIYIALNLQSGSNTALVMLHADNAGEPGAMLETWNISDEMGQFGQWNTPLHLISVGGVELVTDQTFWVVAHGVRDVVSVWNFNNIGSVGMHASQSGGGVWDVQMGKQGAFRVDIVPAPGTLALLGLGGLAAARRRR